MSTQHTALCFDCAFFRVEPAVCDDCKSGNQFQDSSNDQQDDIPVTFHDMSELQ